MIMQDFFNTKLGFQNIRAGRGPSVHTIYLQIAAAGGQQLFGRMGEQILII